MISTITITIKNPVSTADLRNLDGSGSFEVKDGKMVSTQSVDGESSLRGVSDFDKQLPLKVSVSTSSTGRPSGPATSSARTVASTSVTRLRTSPARPGRHV